MSDDQAQPAGKGGAGWKWLLAGAGIGIVLIVGSADRSGQTDRAPDMPAEEKTRLTTLIQALGYNCPAVKIADPRGPVPEGAALRVYCGPADRSGVYENLVYQVIFRDGGALPIVRPGRGP